MAQDGANDDNGSSGPGPAAEEAAGDGGDAAPPAARRSGSRDPRVFVLLRELSEVHLLLDNVSANPTTTVAERSTDEALTAQGLDRQWIEKVCEISWPPDGSDLEKAEDAALLIRAKDYLNRLSHPASGSTIAFTLLVTQEDTGKRRWPWLRKRGESEAPAGAATRSSLAQTAYPDLIGKAIGFRRWMMGISGGLLITLVFTCFLSWYVAYGNAALAALATTRQAAADAQTRVDQAETAAATGEGDEPGEDGAGAGQIATDGGDAEADEGAPAPAPPSSTSVPSTPTEFVSYCRQQPYQGPAQAQQCLALERAYEDLEGVEQRLGRWLCWVPFSDCDDEQKMADAPSRAAAFANIMGSAVLPFLYGLLGAGAAIIRSLSRKIRASLLSPRDLQLSFQQLALGAVIGACIGLFVVAPGSDATGESLLGPVTLSASAISFVAGFGVEAVFQALEALISRIFNIAPAATGNRGDGVTNS